MKKAISFLLCFAFLQLACNKNTSSPIATSTGTPVVTTANISNTTASTAISGVNISIIDNSFIVSGIVWDTSPEPLVSLSTKFLNYNKVGKYSATLTGLSGGLKYYARAFVTTNNNIYYGNEVSFTTPVPSIAIGNSYAGGIIFYVDATKQHGLVAVPVDQAISATWDNGNYQYITTLFTTSTDLGTGAANTAAIIQQLGTTPAGYAAITCKNLVYNGFGDWYLPSRDELTLVKQNLADKNISTFTAGAYWSSSTDNISDFYAWRQDLNSANPALTNIVTGEGVRAVRSF